tara:strand:+ start:73 stop:483 length:411 start_codon:yes stop_codon:yes gene_type:complete
MKSKLTKSLIFCCSVLLCSCDPPHNINFENQSDSQVTVTLISNPQDENLDLYQFRDLMKGDSLILNVNTGQTETLYFGIGTWSNSEIESLTNSLNKIIIENDDFKRVYKSKKSINSLLNYDKDGFWWKTQINIKVE